MKIRERRTKSVSRKQKYGERSMEGEGEEIPKLGQSVEEGKD